MASPQPEVAARSGPPDGARAARPARPDAGIGLTLRLPGFVAVSTVLAAAVHTLAGPGVAASRLLALAALGVALVAVPARGRPLSLPGAVVLVTLGQVVAHAVLSLCHCSATSVPGRFVHRVLCPDLLGAQQARWDVDPLRLDPPATGYLEHLVPATPMLAAHLLAIAATGWLLHRGDAVLWRAARAVRPRPVILETVLLMPDAVPRVRLQADPPAALHCLVGAVTSSPHRGPPPPG